MAGIEKHMSSPGRPGLPRRFVCLIPIIPSLRAIEYGAWHPPGAMGGRGPKNCTVMARCPPGPGDGAGRSFLEKNDGDARRWQAAQRPGGGHRRGQGAAAQTQVQVGGLREVGAGSSRPQPQLPAFGSQSISWQRKKRAEGQKAGEIGRRRGAQRKGPWEGEGSYANSTIHRIPRPLIKAPAAAAAGSAGVEARTGSPRRREAAMRGKQGAPNKRRPCPLHPRNSSDGGHAGKARTPAAKVWAEAAGGPQQVGPRAWDSRGPSSFVRASWSENGRTTWTPQTPPSTSRAGQAGFFFQGFPRR